MNPAPSACLTHAAASALSSEERDVSVRRIAIVGSRDYPRLDFVRQFVWELDRDAIVVSGDARGVDKTATTEAQRLCMAYEEHRADWNRYGKRAGPIRNAEIVNRADEVAAFWDGYSRGTEITMRMAHDAGRPLRVFGPDGLPLAWPA